MMIINPDASIAEIAVMLASFAEAALLSPAIVRTTSLPAMAASYDPDPTQFLGIRLPVTLATCEVIAERWANWSRQDPVVAVETQADNLRRLKALRIDCGERDQFNLLYGARRFVRRLNELGIAHRHEEFPDNHSGVDYWMDESLPFLAQAFVGIKFCGPTREWETRQI